MNEIKLLVKNENLETVMSALNNLGTGLISKIETTSESVAKSKDAPSACNIPNQAKVIQNNHSSAFTSRRISAKEKRRKLFSFAFITLVVLSIAAIYFEVYDKTYVPPFLRVLLAIYWFYSLAGIIVAKRGSDEWVSKVYFNVSK